MTDVQTRGYNMGTTVEQLMNDNAAFWATVIIIAQYVADLSSSLDVADALRGEQQQSTKPITGNKNTVKREMANMGDAISDGIETWSRNNSLPIQADEFARYTFSYLNSRKGADALSRNQFVYAKADSMRIELATLGFTDVIIDDYNLKIVEFNGLLGKADAKIAERAAVTIDLGTEIENIKEIVDNMEKSMGIFKLTNPSFFNAFMNGRKIDDTGKRHISLRVLVKEQVTGAVLPEAKGTIEETGTTAQSGLTGKMNFFSMGAGVYTLKVELEGYATSNVDNVVVEPEGITDLVVEMVKL